MTRPVSTYASIREFQMAARAAFGPDPSLWRFRCPVCGHVATPEDFRQANADPQRAATECIGRVTGKGDPNQGGPCNYAAFGLIRLGDRIHNDGNVLHVLPFAKALTEGETA